MQHYRTAENLLPAIPVPGTHRGRLLCCQPLTPTLDLFPLCRLLTGVDTIQMLPEAVDSLNVFFGWAPATTLAGNNFTVAQETKLAAS